MRKFLTVSVCLFASLMANAKVEVTPSAEGSTNPDVITISGMPDANGNYITKDDVDAARKQLNMSAVKIVTAEGVKLTKDDWSKIILNYGPNDQLIKENVSSIDLSDVVSVTNLDFDFKNAFTCDLHKDIETVIWSRYDNVPDGCFNGNPYITSITIPNKDGKATSIRIGVNAFHQMEGLEKLIIGDCVEDVIDGDGNTVEAALGNDFASYCTNLSYVTFNTPKIKTLPARSFQMCTSLKLIDLPYNLKVVGTSAFHGCKLETISFPNSLTTIEANAFQDCDLQYVVIPENVSEIQTCAFNGNKYLSDVYVMGSNVKCSQGAFKKEQISLQFTNTDETGTLSTRESWETENSEIKNSYYYQNPVVLHYVGEQSEAKERYQNPYFRLLNETIDGKDIITLIKEKNINGNGDEGAKELARSFKLWKGDNTLPQSLIDYANGKTTDCPFAIYEYIDAEGKNASCRMWRNEGGYYSDSDIANANGGDEYAGWKQFLLIEDNAKKTTKEDDHRISDMWYSMCFPFALTANQIRTAFGAGTDVCEFVGAWEGTNENGDKTITFRFNPVLSATATIALQSGDSNSGLEEITVPNKAYMIHPASKKADDGTLVTRVIPNVSIIEADQSLLVTTRPTPATVNMEQFNEGGSKKLLSGEFEFIGNYNEEKTLPVGCYYFSYSRKNDATSLVLNHLTKSVSNKWTSMTALLLPTSSNSSSAKLNVFNFAAPSEINNGGTTGIKEVNNDSQNTKRFNLIQKIYNMNGQVVKEGTSLEGLSKGIYILNGKKYIVK